MLIDPVIASLIVTGVLAVFVCLSIWMNRRLYTPMMSFWNEAYLLWSIIIIAPIVEEAVFRMFIPTYCNMYHIGTILFGLSHYSCRAGRIENLIQMTGTMIIGHVLLLLDNVIYAILVHAMFNLSSYAITRIAVTLLFNREPKRECMWYSDILHSWYNPQKHSTYSTGELLNFYQKYKEATPSLSGYNFLGILPSVSDVITVANAGQFDYKEPAHNGSNLLHFAMQSCNESLIADLLESGDFKLFDDSGGLIPGTQGMVIFDFEINFPLIGERPNHINLLQVLLRQGVPPDVVMNAIRAWVPAIRESDCLEVECKK